MTNNFLLIFPLYYNKNIIWIKNFCRWVGYIIYKFYYKIVKGAYKIFIVTLIYGDKYQNSSYPRGWWGTRGLTAKGHKGTFWSDGNVLYLDWGGIQLSKLIEPYI